MDPYPDVHVCDVQALSAGIAEVIRRADAIRARITPGRDAWYALADLKASLAACNDEVHDILREIIAPSMTDDDLREERAADLADFAQKSQAEDRL